MSKGAKIILALVLIGTCLLVCTVLIIAVVVGSYYGVGGVVFDEYFQVSTCKLVANTPGNFSGQTGCDVLDSVNLDNLFVPAANWTTISYPSVDNLGYKGTISAFFMENKQNPGAPLIVAIHGLNSCKKAHYVLSAGTTLWKAGYHVLIPDLRNQGDSTVESDYATFGWREHADVLAGVDYLTIAYPHLAYLNSTINRKVGTYGCSMGGATALIVLKQDRRVKAALVESPAADIIQTFIFNAKQLGKGAGDVLVKAACAAGSVKKSAGTAYGCPPYPLDPQQSALNLGPGKYLFIQHPESDLKVPYPVGVAAADAARASGANVTIFSYDKAKEMGVTLSRSTCDNHCQMDLFDLPSFQARLINFFNSVFSQT